MSVFSQPFFSVRRRASPLPIPRRQVCAWLAFGGCASSLCATAQLHASKPCWPLAAPPAPPAQLNAGSLRLLAFGSMATSSSSYSGDSESEEVHIEEGERMRARGQQAAALRQISSGLCGFSHTLKLQPRHVFCLQVTHNEVACGEHIDLKLLLESLAGHAIAATKNLKLWMDQERRQWRAAAADIPEHHFLSQLPPPPPPPPSDAAGRWQHAKGGKAKAKGGGKGGGKRKGSDGHEHEEITPEEEIINHEGEQRVWAYPLHFIKLPTPFPEETDKDIAYRFLQFRLPEDASELMTTHAAGASTDLKPTNVNCASSLLARAIGSNGVVDTACHFAVRALTLSLAEVFRAYREVTTSKEIYTQWLKGRTVVGPRTRSMSIPPPPGGGTEGTASESARVVTLEAVAKSSGARRRDGGTGRRSRRSRSRSRRR